MSDLIERYGYERAVRELKAMDDRAIWMISGCLKYREEVRKECLEYRREHNIFEVGDKVVFKNNWTANDLVLTIDGATKNSIRLDTVLDLKKHFRHATPEEIQAGRRL